LAKVPSSLAPLKYFAYLTDKEMATYFTNPSNGLCGIYSAVGTAPLRVDASMFQKASRTLASGVASLVIDCRVRGVLAAELARGHSLRVFEVLTP
jgi:hypothetical protein